MRTNLNVSYKEKETVKKLGALWDDARKTWYVENVNNISLFFCRCISLVSAVIPFNDARPPSGEAGSKIGHTCTNPSPIGVFDALGQERNNAATGTAGPGCKYSRPF